MHVHPVHRHLRAGVARGCARYYLASVKLDPDPDNSRLFLTLTFCGNAEKTVSLEASLYGRKVGAVTAKTTQQTLKTVIDLETLSLWSPESPTLYDLDIQVSAEVEWIRFDPILACERSSSTASA